MTPPAAPGEYADLKEELEKIGYRLDVVRRITPAMVERRRQAAKAVWSKTGGMMRYEYCPN